MTIAAAYLMSEGVVLGADSTTTVMTPDGQVAQVFDCAQKVFEIGNGGRMGACTWGAAQLGNTAHRTVFARLADSLGDETVQAAAEKLAAADGTLEQDCPLAAGYTCIRIGRLTSTSCRSAKLVFSAAPDSSLGCFTDLIRRCRNVCSMRCLKNCVPILPTQSHNTFSSIDFRRPSTKPAKDS